ncbi:trypco2 family protein [Streptomyces sp. XD-27]|uniref:trypco2 family protein n=1 Tax=Streptomyces sp. XD-27 TaxID=3062779 RepID=UPI0026F4143D|nr:trypco2 family protein [Streptomyces sp. XD-27]WKX71816.1 trypco2 family protein [Streptomyces sp. XD-27]
MSNGHDDEHIELADAVQAVRDELLEAAARAVGADVVFEVGDIGMEFTVELRKETKGGGRVKAWVVDAGADHTRSETRAHKVSFTLKARDARTGSPWRVRSPTQGGTDRFGRGAGAGDS